MLLGQEHVNYSQRVQSAEIKCRELKLNCLTTKLQGTPKQNGGQLRRYLQHFNSECLGGLKRTKTPKKVQITGIKLEG